MAALTLSGISKRFGTVPVLDDVSMEIESGEFVVLLGASGSGKSTLLRIIAGLDTPDRGTVHIGGRSATELPPAKRDVAMVFQSYALYPHKTVAGNITLPLEMRRLRPWQRVPGLSALSASARATRSQIAADVRQAAAMVGIDHLLDRRPSQLSGGQQQRVALARAMVRRPQLLLMDEPLSNLDARLRTRVRGEICDLHARIAPTIVYVTHDQAEAMTMANRIAVIVEGRIVQVGRPRDLYTQPSDVRVAEILGSPAINLIDGVAIDGWLETAGLRVPLYGELSGRVRVGFRPEAARLVRASAHERNATVVRREHLGADLLLHLTMTGGQAVVVREDPECPTAPGDAVCLSVPPEKLLLFDDRGGRVHPRAVSALVAR